MPRLRHFGGANQRFAPSLTSINCDNSRLISFPRPSALVHEIEETVIAAGVAPDMTTAGQRSLRRRRHVRQFPPRRPHGRADAPHLPRQHPRVRGRRRRPPIRAWKPFDAAQATPDCAAAHADWRALHPRAPLPPWLAVSRLPGHREPCLATAVVWTRDGAARGALLYAPPVATLAVLHALKENCALVARFAVGVAGGLAWERLARPKYWVKSHDAKLRYLGVMFWVLGVKDVFRSLEEGLEEESKTRPQGENEGPKRPNFVEIENGGCFVLE